MENALIRLEIHLFNDLILEFIEKPKLLARYLTYKDWRDKANFRT